MFPTQLSFTFRHSKRKAPSPPLLGAACPDRECLAVFTISYHPQPVPNHRPYDTALLAHNRKTVTYVSTAIIVTENTYSSNSHNQYLRYGSLQEPFVGDFVALR